MLTAEPEAHRADAMLIQQGVVARAAIVPHMYKYKHAGWLVGHWAQDSILAACRKLLDERRGNRSLWRSLNDLSKLAPTIHPSSSCRTGRGWRVSSSACRLATWRNRCSMI